MHDEEMGGTSPSDHAASLRKAHQLIKELSGHLERAHKRLARAEGMLAKHASLHDEHQHRIAALEKGERFPHAEQRPYVQSAKSLSAQLRNFQRAVRSGTL